MKKIILLPLFILFLLIPFYRIFAQDPAPSGIIVESRFFGMTLGNILSELEKKYGVELDFIPSDIPGGIHTGQSFEKVGLNEVMQTLLDGTALHHKLIGNRLIIRKNGVEITYKEK